VNLENLENIGQKIKKTSKVKTSFRDLEKDDIFLMEFNWSDTVVTLAIVKVFSVKSEKIFLNDLKIISATNTTTDLEKFMDFEYDVNYNTKDFRMIQYLCNIPSDLELVEKLFPEVLI